MVEQLKDDLLLRRSRHTNLQVPHSEYVTYDTYPEQDSNLLGTIINQRFRDLNTPDLPPEDISEEDMLEDESSDTGFSYDGYTYASTFIILRFDITEPFVMISVSTDYRFMIVSDTRVYETKVCEYCIQLSEYIGATVFDQYPGIPDERKGIVLAVDDGEPCNTVIAEVFGEEENTFRFVLGDECQSILCGRWDDTGKYESRKEIPNLEDYRLDYEDNYPNYEPNVEIEVMQIRKNIIEGAKIYGTV